MGTAQLFVRAKVENMKKMKLKPYIGPSVKNYAGKKIAILGTVEVVVMCNNEIALEEVYVVDVDEEPLLSRDLCTALKLVERKEVNEVKLDDKELFLRENKDVFEGFGEFVKDFNMELKEGSVGNFLIL
ncbi:hypothetical protein Bhyg_08417 [Pseudolycoriella hygida]|uniref:Uncharacterized protein n=1 Tax=Pseudolycoriella hygida TaxID=35572 RepID=A0A9Q0N4S1_9DIPT|nr:hypothetical protein Bhyg_08417 [Pseudolycoriella hygida]